LPPAASAAHRRFYRIGQTSRAAAAGWFAVSQSTRS